MYKAKCDGITDDSVALQALETAAGVQKAVIQYPAATCKFGTTITMSPAVIHRGYGQGNVYGGGNSILQYTGTTAAFSLQLPNGVNSVQAPAFYDMTINAPNLASGGIAIQYNNPANGFTDDASSQEPMFQPIVERVTINGPNPNGIGIQCSKCFDGRFQNNQINYLNYAMDIEGSDNMAVEQNWMYLASVAEVEAQYHNSFGNYLLISHNDMSSLVSGATAFLNISYRSAYIEYNHEEQDSGTISEMNLINGSVGVFSIHDNLFDAGTSITSCWFSTSGAFVSLSLKNNQNYAGATEPRACFNAGGANAGTPYWYNSTYRQLIDASGNMESNANVPFISQPESLTNPSSYITISGGLVWDFTPNVAGFQNTNAGATINIASNAFVTPPSATDNVSRINFIGPGAVPSGVDLWYCGYGASGTPTVTEGDGTNTYTQVLSTTNACYRMSSNNTDTITALSVKNADTVSGVNIFTTEVKVIVH